MALNPQVAAIMGQAMAAQQAKQAAAAQAKAAYDAIPYATHLANARAAVAAARTAFENNWDAKNPELAATPAQQKILFSKGLPNFKQLVGNRDPAVLAAQKRLNGIITNHLRDQLKAQGRQYGYGWKGNKNEDFHSGNVANLLSSQGITDLSQIGYSKNGKYLMNKETGKNLNWYKDNYTNKNGRGQLGWSAAGKGRTNYYVQRNAQGDPVFYPQWKSNAPKGIGGFVLKAAPAIVGFATGNPALAAATSAALGVAQGQKLGQIAKGAAINYVAGNVGNYAANAATKALPMVGTAGITNAIADTAGGLAQGATSSVLNGQGLKGALPGAITGGVTSGVGALAQDASKGLQQAGLPATAANVATNIVGGGLAPYIASGFDTDAAIAGATNAAAGSAGQLAGQAVNSTLPPGVVNNIASGITQGAVAAGANQLLNPPPSPQPNLLSQHIASIDPRLMQMARAPTTPSTATGGLTQVNQAAVAPGEYIPTGFVAPVKSLPTTGLTPVTDPEMLKRLGIVQ